MSMLDDLLLSELKTEYTHEVLAFEEELRDYIDSPCDSVRDAVDWQQHSEYVRGIACYVQPIRY
jgi:hypothetical protein